MNRMTPTAKALNWTEAETAFPSGHLVSGYHELDSLDRIELIEQLIEAMEPRGRWAMRETKEEDERMIQVLFEDEGDAGVLGDTLHAKQGTRVAGYGSHRWFEFTAKMHEVVSRALKG